jgi:hypothetical protein
MVILGGKSLTTMWNRTARFTAWAGCALYALCGALEKD